jgi:hypothetical protein
LAKLIGSTAFRSISAKTNGRSYGCREEARRHQGAKVLGVGISVNAGAALVYSTRTLDAFDAAA